MDRIKNEPVIVSQLVGLITSIVVVGVALNAFELSAEQVNIIIENLPQIIGGAVLLFGGGAGLVARFFVTPTRKI